VSDPIPEIGGLDDVIRALTAEGDAAELTGRHSALAMFRAARDTSGGFSSPGVQTAPAEPWMGQPAPGQPVPARDRGQRSRGRRRAGRLAPEGAPRRPLIAVLGAALALVLACTGMTAAAYAQVLPDPLQDIAHSVLAPIGVPGPSHSARAGSVAPSPLSPSSSPNVPSPSPTHLPTAATSCPCPSASASAQVTLVLRVARASVLFDGRDTFTGHVGEGGRPGSDLRVKLLEQLSTDPGTWDVIETSPTNASGYVRFVVLHVPADSTFALAGSGPLASLLSDQVPVTVTPRLVVRHPARRVLVVTVHPAVAGDPVTLEQLHDGTWVTVATEQLSSLLSATFTVTSAGGYRFLLPATSAHQAGVSRVVAVADKADAVVTPSATPQPNRIVEEPPSSRDPVV
jgi:hypothetical protein